MILIKKIDFVSGWKPLIYIYLYLYVRFIKANPTLTEALVTLSEASLTHSEVECMSWPVIHSQRFAT